MAGEPRKRLGELLLEAGVIDAAQLQAALGHQRQWGARLGQALVDLKLAAESDIVQALSRKYGYQVARLDALQPYALQQALRLVPREFAVRHNVLPMAADPAAITVAMADPTNLSVVDELGFRTGRRVKICVGGDREIAAAVRKHYPTEGGGGLEAIALDLEADEAPGEPVLDPFGGGSKDALEAFFGSGPAPSPSAGGGGPAASRQPPGPAAAPGAARAQGAAPAPGAPHPTPPGAQPPAASVRPPAPSPSPAPGMVRPAPHTGAAGPGPARATAPGAGNDPAVGAQHGPGLELEDAHGAEAMEHARAAFLGAIPPGGLADADEPLHRHAPPPLASPGPAGAPTQPRADAAPSRGTPGGSGPQPPQFTARERAILDALDRLAGGAHAEPELLKPAQAMAAVIRILIRRGVITERELLDELRRR